MKILFLDVDGVLNRCGKSGHGLEADKIALLKTIVDATGCEIVLSSTWRLSTAACARLDAALTAAQILWDGRLTAVYPHIVNGIYHADTRGREIQGWLDGNSDEGEERTFVILDDDADMGPLLPHLVKTDSYTGLTPELAQEAIARLNTPTS